MSEELQSSEGLTGLDVQDGSFGRLAADAGCQQEGQLSGQPECLYAEVASLASQSHHGLTDLTFKLMQAGAFPGGPVIKTLSFQYKGNEFDFWSEN